LAAAVRYEEPGKVSTVEGRRMLTHVRVSATRRSLIGHPARRRALTDQKNYVRFGVATGGRALVMTGAMVMTLLTARAQETPESQSGRAAGSKDRDDKIFGGRPPRTRQEVADSKVYVWVLGENWNRDTTRQRLDRLARQKIAVVDLVCGLSDAQKQKLELVARGDNNRLIERLEEIGRRLQLAKNDATKVEALAKESKSLRFPNPESANPESDKHGPLFAKTLANALTPRQLASYQVLRAVDRVGGYVWMHEVGSERVLQISLIQTAVTDEDLAILRGLTAPLELCLQQTRVTERGLSYLKGLPLRGELNLSYTRVTDAGLAHLKGATGLRQLSLEGTQITDSGLAHLSGLANLQALRLRSTKVTDGGLAHLTGLTKLQGLGLDNTRVTDAGLAQLKGLTSLEYLSLANTRVTDAGLAHLKELTRLKTLVLQRTRVTKTGTDELKRNLPGLVEMIFP
jgi:hypothetical protein